MGNGIRRTRYAISECSLNTRKLFQKRDRLNKKAKKLGYKSAEEMIEKTKSNEISPWLAEVYGKLVKNQEILTL